MQNSVMFSPVAERLCFQDVVKILLQRGAGVNSQDKDNITALMEASIMDHRDVVKHLLKVQSRSCDTLLCERDTHRNRDSNNVDDTTGPGERVTRSMTHIWPGQAWLRKP